MQNVQLDLEALRSLSAEDRATLRVGISAFVQSAMLVYRRLEDAALVSKTTPQPTQEQIDAENALEVIIDLTLG